MAKKPNFLFIVTDQQRADHLGCYGNPIVRTPNIDSLARRGLACGEFYVSCPICMPNRATILTGRTPTANGVRQNGIPLSLDAVTFVDLLKADGYSTGLIGKAHFQNLSKLDVSLEAPGPPSVETAVSAPQQDADPNRSRPTRGVGSAPVRREDVLWNATREWRTGPGYDREWLGQWLANPDYRVPTPYYGFDHVEIANGHGDWVGGDYAVWRSRQDRDIAGKVGPANTASTKVPSPPRRPGGRLCRRNCGPAPGSPTGRSTGWRTGPDRTSPSSCSTASRTRTIPSARRANTGICTIRRRFRCPNPMVM